MIKCEVCDREIVPLHEHSFPEDIRDETKYCVCIPWETMEKCIELSLNNAQRLVEDAEYLLNGGRLSSATILSIFALEESGKALLAYEYAVERKKIPIKDYRKRFLNHKAKIDKSSKAIQETSMQRTFPSRLIWGDLANELRKETLKAIFVDYNGRTQTWHIPWSQDPKPLLGESNSLGFMNLEMAQAYRQAEESLKKLQVEKALIKDAKMALHLARKTCDKLRLTTK